MKCDVFYIIKKRHNSIVKLASLHAVNKVIINDILTLVNMKCYQMLCVKPKRQPHRQSSIVKNAILYARVSLITNDI